MSAIKFLASIGEEAATAARSVKIASEEIVSQSVTTKKTVQKFRREVADELEEQRRETEELLDEILATTKYENILDQLHNQGREMARRAQKITKGIRDETLKLDDILGLLQSTQNGVAQHLLDILDLFKEGRVSFEVALRDIEIIARALGPNDLTGASARGLANLLQKARRNGDL